jgi:putative ABC transport system permease protein
MLELAIAAFVQAPAAVAMPSQIRRWVVNERTRGQETERAVMSFAEVTAVQSVAGDSTTTGFAEADPVTLPGGRSIRISAVMPNYFTVLGVKPLLGTFVSFGAGGESSDIVLSNDLWHSMFQGSREALGARVSFDHHLYTVSAIAPAGFVGVGFKAADAWVPPDQFLSADVGPNWRATFIFATITRLRSPGLRDVLEARTRESMGRPGTEQKLDLVSLSAARLSEGASQADLTLLVLALLFLACTFAIMTGAALLLARLTERWREMAIVTALGASSARVAGQIAGEFILSTAVAAVLAAMVMLGTFGAGEQLILPQFDILQTPSVGHSTVTLVAGLAAVLCTTSILVALATSRSDLLKFLHGGALTDRHVTRAHGWLISAEAGLAFVFTLVSLLFLHSLHRVATTPLGIEPHQFAFAQVSAENSPAALALARRIESRVVAVNGVDQASIAEAVPLVASSMTIILAPGGPIPADINAVDTNYFATVGTRILSGRAFTADDRFGAPRVAVVNTVLASTYWPGVSPLGKCLYVAPPPYTCYEVVGVAEATRKLSITEPAAAQFYVPQLQNRHPGPLFVLARFSPGRMPLDSLDRASSQAGGVSSDFRFRNLDRVIAPQLRPWRLAAFLTSTIAALSLLSAVLALYAVASRAVNQRARELALRRALGAGAGRLAAGVVTRVIGLVGLGVAIAVPLAIAVAPKMPLLYATSPTDLRVWLEAAMTIAMAALLAAIPSALRASRSDPAAIMRA